MKWIIATAFFFFYAGITPAQQLAFPGAEGYGKYTTGGRGGAVVEVTNLNGDESPGSLRAALKTLGNEPITVVFRVSGDINLNTGTVKVGRSNITIAGQTAPGEGVCIRKGYLKFNGSNLIIRYMRFRPGDELNKADLSCLGNENSKNVIIDHCSLSWSNEESHTCYDNKFTTVQWCILSEGLYNSFDSKGARGYGGQWGGQYASYHHNLLAHNVSRSPRINGCRSHDTVALCDYRNNVIYNWGKAGAVYGGEKELDAANALCHINWINNYYKPGPATAVQQYFAAPSYESHKGAASGYGQWYIAGNYMEGGSKRINRDNWQAVDITKVGSVSNVKSDTSFTVEAPVTETAEAAYKSVLAGAGATRPARDSVDTRIVAEASGKLQPIGTGIYGNRKGIIDSQTGAGGWPGLRTGTPPADSDHDGMPDDWEKTHGLDPQNAADRNKIAADGYTMLEKYLNS